jgi:hypothetical protein
MWDGRGRSSLATALLSWASRLRSSRKKETILDSMLRSCLNVSASCPGVGTGTPDMSEKYAVRAFSEAFFAFEDIGHL